MSEDVYELMGYDKENKKVITASSPVFFTGLNGTVRVQ